MTRVELQEALWPETEFGAFDIGLNTVIRKVRRSIGDSARSQRWIETLPKVGYRFRAAEGEGHDRTSRLAVDSVWTWLKRLALSPFRVSRAAPGVVVYPVRREKTALSPTTRIGSRNSSQ